MLYQWIYIDFNSYFASVEQQLDPNLRGKPVAVVPMDTDYTCAIAASYEAKAFGIKTGTMIYEAKQLCPDLICIPANHENYVYFHHELLKEIDRHIPVEQVRSIDECVCNLQGKEQTAEGSLILANQIKQGIHQNIGEAINCSIGVSTNRYLAKVASNMQKPDGFTILAPENFCHHLSNKNLDFLPGIGRNMLKRLNDNDIFTIKDLYALEPKQMRKIWHSVGGERFWHMIRGVELPEQATSRNTVGHSHVIEPTLRPTAKARNVASRLLMKAASRLRRLGYYSTRMNLSVRIEKGQKVKVSKQFYRARDSFTLAQQLYELWDFIVEEHKPKRIKKISIDLYGLVANEEVQPGLLENLDLRYKYQIEKFDKISNAVDNLNARFGRDTIVIGGLPERKHNFSGTKIAFDRIPDLQEFHE